MNSPIGFQYEANQKVKDLPSLLEAIRGIHAEFAAAGSRRRSKDENERPVRLWFRGEYDGGDEEFKDRVPEPKLLRGKNIRHGEQITGPERQAALDEAWDCWRIEANVRALLKSRGGQLLDQLEGFVPQVPLEWSFVAQHYNMPSRLLDWSASSLTAAFFAVNSAAHYDWDCRAADQREAVLRKLLEKVSAKGVGLAIEKDVMRELRHQAGDHAAAIWVLEPRCLIDDLQLKNCENIQTAFTSSNSLSKGYFLQRDDAFPGGFDDKGDSIEIGSVAPTASGSTAWGNSDHWAQKSPEALEFLERSIDPRVPPRGPIPVMPQQYLKRIVSQESRFTLHPIRSGALLEVRSRYDDEKMHPFARKIVVDVDAKKSIREELRTHGVNAFSIFRDLDHLAPFFHDWWKEYGARV